jgi:hypothetical protein
VAKELDIVHAQCDASPPTDTAVGQHQHPMLAGLRGQPSNIIGRQIPATLARPPRKVLHSARRIGCPPSDTSGSAPVNPNAAFVAS